MNDAAQTLTDQLRLTVDYGQSLSVLRSRYRPPHLLFTDIHAPKHAFFMELGLRCCVRLLLRGQFWPELTAETLPMDADRFEGTARNIGGKVQEAAGSLMGDAATQLRGKVNEAAGSAQDAYGQTVDHVKAFTSEQPIGALFAAVTLGVVLGLILGRR
jgi:uncharacterized protein YjbJ (UPF0337 family)